MIFPLTAIYVAGTVGLIMAVLPGAGHQLGLPAGVTRDLPFGRIPHCSPLIAERNLFRAICG